MGLLRVVVVPVVFLHVACADSVDVTIDTADVVSGETETEVLLSTGKAEPFSVDLYVGDRRVGHLEQRRPIVFTWPADQFPDGPVELRAEVSGGGVDGSATRQITIDNTAPELDASMTFPMVVTARDDTSGIDDLVIDTPGKRQHCTADGQFTLEFSEPTCGPLAMALTATDAAGNQTVVERNIVLDDDAGCVATALTAPLSGGSCGEPEIAPEPDCELLPGGLNPDGAIDGVSFGFVVLARPMARRYQFEVGDFSVMLRGEADGGLIDHQQVAIERDPATRLWHLDNDEMSLVFQGGDSPPPPPTLAALLLGGLRVNCTESE